jgi:hypothetical protein
MLATKVVLQLGVDTGEGLVWSGSEGAGGQHLDLLCVVNLGSGVNYFLSCFEEFLGEVAKL